MQSNWEDYYKILQVHFLAEPEMIHNAYRKLSKKYHPDVNRSIHSEQRMKEIIRAYEVLGDPQKRQQYFAKWVEKNSRFQTSQQQSHSANYNSRPIFHNQIEAKQIKETLLNYLDNIACRDYLAAYNMLSACDQAYVRQDDFIKWQELVAEIFELQRYDCELQDVYHGLAMGNKQFEKVADLEVKVIERNHIMGRQEKDELSKSVVLENRKWNVYLGRKDLSKIIAKFQELAKIKNRRRVFTFRTVQSPFIEQIPGVLGKHAFIERAKMEQTRYNRYGNVFSVIVVELVGDEIDQEIYKQMGIIIVDYIRNLDFVSRWKNNGFIIVLPETDGGNAVKAASKLSSTLHDMFDRASAFHNKYSMRITVTEQRFQSFKELYLSINGPEIKAEQPSSSEGATEGATEADAGNNRSSGENNISES